MATEQTEFKLTITKDGFSSTDTSFDLNNLYLGDDYETVDACFVGKNGEEVRRDSATRFKSEPAFSMQTLPRIAFQIYESEFAQLSEEERVKFPICRYSNNEEMICGIYSTLPEFKSNKGNTWHCVRYYDANNKLEFVIHSRNIFSTIYFLKECLRRWGQEDKFVLTYKRKADKSENNTENQGELGDQLREKLEKYSDLVTASKNVIFRGAPGTGKSYLAKQIAAYIISDGQNSKYATLTDEQKKQVEFVQFHPSYDYTDFVEGLRPTVEKESKTIGFELRDGIFKQFITRARTNYENARKTKDIIEKEQSVQKSMEDFFSSIEMGVSTFKTISGNEFTINSVEDGHVNIYIPKNPNRKYLTLNLDEIRKMLESGQDFKKIKDITAFFGKDWATQEFSYDFALYKEIKVRKSSGAKQKVYQEEQKPYVFIIDEINRGEISKIFGELFYAIDPGYRGKNGEISTQYSNLHEDPTDKFYIPENVYIIGTMNDIDRSVDTFDFAMRRRFRFKEISAEDSTQMLDQLNDSDKRNEAVNRMKSLNEAIKNTEGLNENYQIGASYFLKLDTLDFDQLWKDYLYPLLQEYVRGMPKEADILDDLKKAYCNSNSSQSDVSEDSSR